MKNEYMAKNTKLSHSSTVNFEGVTITAGNQKSTSDI